jgi:hydroxylaminobenzene mutase
MEHSAWIQRTGGRLLQAGATLFLLGLLTGFTLPLMANPRMGLSSHLEGVMNGILLLVLGAIWGRLDLGPAARRIAFWLALFGTFANWAVTLLAGFWGAGRMMPIAAAGHEGTPIQEILITASLWALSVAMVAVTAMVIWGLRGAARAALATAAPGEPAA